MLSGEFYLKCFQTTSGTSRRLSQSFAIFASQKQDDALHPLEI